MPWVLLQALRVPPLGLSNKARTQAELHETTNSVALSSVCKILNSFIIIHFTSYNFKLLHFKEVTRDFKKISPSLALYPLSMYITNLFGIHQKCLKLTVTLVLTDYSQRNLT